MAIFPHHRKCRLVAEQVSDSHSQVKAMEAIQSHFLSRFASFSQFYIIKTLSGITYGRLILTLRDGTEPQDLFFGTPAKTDAVAPEASLIVNKANVWTRLSMNLDVVSTILQNFLTST